MLVQTSILALLVSASVSAAGINEPPNGKLYLGAWLDTADSVPGANDGDRPALLNKRLGFNIGAIQYAQNLPIPAGSFPFPIEQIEATGLNTTCDA
eukprot:jgi/Hompol1/5293/HPOL_001255-RA